MGTPDAPDKSRGGSFQLAIGTVSCAQAATWKRFPLSKSYAKVASWKLTLSCQKLGLQPVLARAGFVP